MVPSRRALVRVGAVLLLAAGPACRRGEGGADRRDDGGGADVAPGGGDASTSTSPGPSTTEDPDGEVFRGDAGARFREAGPKVEEDLDAPPDPACTGAEIAFASAVVDTRCEIGSGRAKKLRALVERDGGSSLLRQEAKAVEEGRVALRLVNKGGASLSLPLSFHGKLPAFSVLAEDERHTLYELEPPPLALRDPGQGNRSHFARIVLAPGAAAVATIAIVPTIVRVLGRGAGDTCKDAGAAGTADGGPCNLTRLPKGQYVLHVGQLLTDVEAGPPARVTWDLP